MATNFHERAGLTLAVIEEDIVTAREAYVHVYKWLKYEWTAKQKRRLTARGERQLVRLNEDLAVFKLRKEMAEIEL